MADLGTIECRTPLWPHRRCALPLSSIQSGATLATSRYLTPARQYVAWWVSFPSVAVNVQGTLSGVVNDNSVPVSRCMVRLYYRLSGALIKSTLTDASGAFSFPGLDTTDLKAYFCIAFDPDGGEQYNAIIFDRLTAT